jgi:predicted lysophospholipase L1 biosynthesis ABC-type transport system permease subunit
MVAAPDREPRPPAIVAEEHLRGWSSGTVLEHSREKAGGRWRRWTFRIWIAITLVFAAYVAVLLAFVHDERIGHFLLGVPVPFVMILLLLVGLGWLVWFVTARRRPPGPVRH